MSKLNNQISKSNSNLIVNNVKSTRRYSMLSLNSNNVKIKNKDDSILIVSTNKDKKSIAANLTRTIRRRLQTALSTVNNSNSNLNLNNYNKKNRKSKSLNDNNISSNPLSLSMSSLFFKNCDSNRVFQKQQQQQQQHEINKNDEFSIMQISTKLSPSKKSISSSASILKKKPGGQIPIGTRYRFKTIKNPSQCSQECPVVNSNEKIRLLI